MINDSCVFCRLIRRELPVSMFWENENFCALLDLYPNTPGVTLLVTKEHEPSDFLQLSKEISSEVFVAAQEVMEIMKKQLCINRIAFACEGMGIDHFHLKLYPLHGVKAEYKPVWSERHEWFEQYPGYITTALGPQAPRIELDALATKLRGNDFIKNTTLFGPYRAYRFNDEKKLLYVGNKNSHLYDSYQNAINYQNDHNRVATLCTNKHWTALQKIEDTIFIAATQYFQKIGARWCNVPLTTTMISSPGEIYAGRQLDYTTDALPIELSWFDYNRKIFLTESAQFYLEMRLLMQEAERVFTITNSFRKEKADATHASEFHHIEFEGRVTLDETIQIATELLKSIIASLIRHNIDELSFYLCENEIEILRRAFEDEYITDIKFVDALNLLYEDTGDEKYKDFTLKNFGAWEEIRLTELLQRNVWVRNFPLEEVPFYHCAMQTNEQGKIVAANADFIAYRYREIIGSGARISDTNALLEKARRFSLPIEDYEPCIALRNHPNYKSTSGFGLGCERFVQWILKLPAISEASHFPRGHWLPRP